MNSETNDHIYRGILEILRQIHDPHVTLLGKESPSHPKCECHECAQARTYTVRAYTDEDIEAQARARATLAERERCAKICDDASALPEGYLARGVSALDWAEEKIRSGK